MKPAPPHQRLSFYLPQLNICLSAEWNSYNLKIHLPDAWRLKRITIVNMMCFNPSVIVTNLRRLKAIFSTSLSAVPGTTNCNFSTFYFPNGSRRMASLYPSTATRQHVSLYFKRRRYVLVSIHYRLPQNLSEISYSLRFFQRHKRSFDIH
jgi:hypothetical protein